MTPLYIDRANILAAAREYIGVPFKHQGRGHAGIDCGGLITCTAYDCTMRDIQVTGYRREPNPPQFRAILAANFDPVAFDDLAPADILTFALPAEQHLAIVTALEPLTILHAYEAAGCCIEQPVSPTWRRRIRGCWRFREAAPWLPED